MKTSQLLFTTLVLFGLTACGSNKHGESSTPDNVGTLANSAFVYDNNSPYKETLLGCIEPDDVSSSCTLNTLPLIAQESSGVTKNMIMQRLVVSDKWMGERFSQLLDHLAGKEIYTLFGSVTAVVIHKDIIPSFYTTTTGAIYIDPRYLWVTDQESKTITQKEDFRSDFGSQLQFIAGSYSTHNGYSIRSQVEMGSGQDRNFNDTIAPFAGLLYHELAHANDFIPPSMIDSLDTTKIVSEVIRDISNSRVSSALYNYSPLTSSELLSLGKVMYHGHTATEEEKDLSGYVAGALFDEEDASDIYAYSTMYEDTATLFADTMMKLYFNVNNNVVFVNADKLNNQNVIELEWGVRNPVAKASVAHRAIFVSDRLNPKPNGWNELFHTHIGSVAYLQTNQNEKPTFNKSNIDLKNKIRIEDFKYLSF
ncbi:MAG: Unknown protein [uncultured Sulfurovum sp.]|uniref:Lipoprotein n=1 Tax=uncultured Sulfurovum sp. TaxID=269237 RepID=A0A6S6S2B7_9BACT|nr:MAG: Unknown protein [uncultured Sulfurovum sp.]